MATLLPEVKIVRHVRAKSLRLRVYPHEIRLTAPAFCTQKQIQHFLKQSEDWLQETWQKVRQTDDVGVPSHIQLFDHSVSISIKQVEQKKLFIFDAAQHMLYLQQEQAAQALKAFIVDYAKRVLPPVLKQVSQDTGLVFQSSQIRHAKSRWGSCSTQQKIMLNAALVLLPAPIIRYVCVHELVHTVHFDHSPAFWRTVRHFDADYEQHRDYLKTIQWPLWWLES